MYWSVRREARLVMQMSVATRAWVKRMPSDASLSSRGVLTMLFPAAPIESHRVSSITSTTMFSGRSAFCGAPPAWVSEMAAANASAADRIRRAGLYANVQIADWRLQRGKRHPEPPAQVRDTVEAHLERVLPVDFRKPLDVAHGRGDFPEEVLETRRRD